MEKLKSWVPLFILGVLILTGFKFAMSPLEKRMDRMESRLKDEMKEIKTEMINMKTEMNLKFDQLMAKKIARK